MSRDQIPQPLAAVAPALEGGGDVEARRCGRCRRVFEDDPTLDIQGRTDWSLCAPCEAVLFPRRARSSAVLTLVPPVDSSAPTSSAPTSSAPTSSAPTSSPHTSSPHKSSEQKAGDDEGTGS